MAFTYQGRTLNKIGVVGSGQIGPDIALHFTKVMAPHGTPVVVVDIADEALANGQAKVSAKVRKGVDSGAFKPARAEAMLANLTFTSDYDALKGADFVIEAATENPAVKAKIVDQLESLCGPGAVLVSNSSHMEPEVIFAGAGHKNRTAVVHYFFPAERNPVVEVVPGADTDEDVASWLLSFYTEIGKVPIRVGSRYGYAIDPIFEGLLETSVLLVEAGVATPKEIDTVARKRLGLGVGPFTAHNLTGGNPITNHGLGEMHTKLGPWFRSPALLQEMVEKNQDWEIPGRKERVEVAPETAQRVGDALAATYLGLCCEAVDAGITNVADLEMAVELALVVRPPFAMMNEMGVPEALQLVERFAADHEHFPVAGCLREQAASGEPWNIPYVLREDRDGVAVLTIRRPRVLNALNATVFDQLSAHASALAADDSIAGVVITGFGRKAFVSGADVGFLAKIQSAQEGEATARHSQLALQAIANLDKPVVCAMNGLAFGGGNELAMACHARVCRKGLRVLAGQPEPNLGIIPGAGATQRLPRLVGVENAATLLRTGRPISSAEAVEMGLVREEVDGDVVAAAVDLARRAAKGDTSIKRMSPEPLPMPDALAEVDLGHLSRAVDAIMVRAILEGCAQPLAEGIAFEAKMFGEVCKTRDMRIGVQTFMEKGARAKAEFVHA